MQQLWPDALTQAHEPNFMSRARRIGQRYLLGAFTALLMTAQPSFAALQNNEQLAEQRQLFEQLYDQVGKGRLSQARKNLSALDDYPLKPYLEARMISRQLESLNAREVNRFVEQNMDLPVTETLQQKWLNTLAARNDWAGYRQSYQLFPPRGSHYKCLMLKAEMKQGSLAKHLDKVTELWIQGRSQPKSCDAVFAFWQRQGGLTSSVAETRFWNAVKERNFSLARYAEKKISQSAGRKKTALLWQVRSHPERWLTRKSFSSSDHTHRIIVDYAVRRLAQKDMRLAARRWLSLRDHLNFTPEQKAKLNHYLGIRLALRFYDDAPELVAKIDPDFQDAEITEWRIRLALSQQDWPQVQLLIDKLPEEQQLTSRWQYWQAVAEQNITGQSQNERFSRIAVDRSYYGFLASEQLGQPFTLNYEPASFSASLQQNLLLLPSVRRMYELIQLEQFNYARQEWNLLFPTLNAEQKYALSHLAGSWEWHSQAIAGAAQVRKWNDLQLRFPLEYAELYQQSTRQRNIPLNWALSITRQESAFNPLARSGVGAMGLMQLMPKTARQTAKKIRQNLSAIKELYNPATNIALGTAYLAQMLDRFDGSRIYATAAYNAGPYRVKGWLKKRGHLPLDIWVEVIPYKETRTYVQRVLEYGVVYDMMANRPTRLLDDSERQLLALNFLNDDGAVVAD
ncbi:transglycosylase SLT domain-containing protein [Oceanospirillum linum]|nr:transglycosylase SLT domain-containing protein [Oceanospirillum linum]SEG19780.1 soluble lytic murein transglycosylase [Oleiphilus messinensis]SMP24315.1 soluble lytic murein transglycosylase [Oceanospirillum linum]